MPAGLSTQAMTRLRAQAVDLAGRALEPSIFNDPAFVLPAATHLAGRWHPRFLLAWDPHCPGRLIGLCCVAPPLPGMPVSAWLHPQATAAFPLLDAGQARLALGDLMAQTGGRIRPAGLVIHGLPADGPTLRMIEAEPGWAVERIAARSRAVVRRSPAPPAGKAGKEFRRQAKRLAELGEVAWLSTADPAGLGPALDDLLHLEAVGWKGRRGTALIQRKGRAAFVHVLVDALGIDGRCRIDTLALDGRPIAAGLVLRSGAAAFFWKTAFDERYARFSPGAHLAEAVGRRQGQDPTVEVTDSCAIPGHSMIDRLWPERRTVIDALVVAAPEVSRGGRAFLAGEQAWRAMRQRLVRLRGAWRADR